MICISRQDGWELVYQNAHGLVAMKLLAPLRADLRPDVHPDMRLGRWDDVLFATAQHDNGWQEHEPGDNLTPLGTPRHFEETTTADVVRQSEMALGRVWHASVFSGLLLVEHFKTLYGTHPDAAVQAMLRRQKAAAAKARRRLGLRQAEVATHYAPLRWADTLSLTLCLGRLTLFPNRRVELERLGGTPTYAWQRDDGSVGLDPWPYDVPEVAITTEVYRLRQLTFPSADALARAIASARMETRAWTLRRD